MTGADVAMLFARMGPIAAQLLLQLADKWDKTMTPEELKAFCLNLRKTEEEFVAAERLRRLQT